MKKLLATLALVALAAVATAPATAAHEGEGTIEVVAATPEGDLSVRYQLRVTFVADGHGAPDATVTATVVDPAGARTPVAFTKGTEDGIYEGTGTYPAAGTWATRFTSLRPTSTLERPQEVTTPATTSTLPTATAPRASQGSDAASDDSPAKRKNPLPLYVGGMLVAAGVAVGLRLQRRHRTDTT